MAQNLFEIFAHLEKHLSEATEYQRTTSLKVAQQINPRFTTDDILQPQDYPELMQHADFQFEDGRTSGMFSALMIVRRYLREKLEPDFKAEGNNP